MILVYIDKHFPARHITGVWKWALSQKQPLSAIKQTGAFVSEVPSVRKILYIGKPKDLLYVAQYAKQNKATICFFEYDTYVNQYMEDLRELCHKHGIEYRNFDQMAPFLFS